ncbi:lipid A deacylase LpxR family protein [Acetobacter sp. AN02]|uniref:lipid A deacylase LpxR family protein n=1 Tax=Acetobacter sp. AN02 TaxID=2894186 RepID=UPI00243458E7|nr:lipid A deacylase LpxR family protein [Acetobacter sp. AN02]MDG6093949.1 lipid A deacylase LpxR family protein [Acetobacter sp. AN02]
MRQDIRLTKQKILVSLMAIAGLTPVSAAMATPLQDKQGTWTIQGENDAVSTLNGTSDQYYTSGLRVNWTSGTDNLPKPFADMTSAILGKGMQRVSMGIQQLIFTPSDTQIAVPSSRDRPYAGLLLGTVNFISDTDLSRGIFGIQAGMMGPSSLARQVQNGFHGAIGDTKNKGWSHQLANQPIFQIQYGRIWRLPVARIGSESRGISFDVLPAASARAGDYRISGTLGSTFRFGQGLDSDFGISTIGDGTDGTNAYKATRPFAWYAFGGVNGTVVGYDATLQGNTMRSNSPHVDMKRTVGQIRAGLAVMFYGVRLSYAQVWETQEFTTARSGLFNYGSLMLSAKF